MKYIINQLTAKKKENGGKLRAKTSFYISQYFFFLEIIDVQ